MYEYETATVVVEPASPPVVASATPPASVIRSWAKANGLRVGARGPVNPKILTAYQQAHVELG